jgi:hypothetical protein
MRLIVAADGAPELSGGKAEAVAGMREKKSGAAKR